MTPAQAEKIRRAKQAVRVILPGPERPKPDPMTGPGARLINRLAALSAEDLPAPGYTKSPESRPSTAHTSVWWVIRRPRSRGGDVYVTVSFQSVQTGLGPQGWSLGEYSMHFGPIPRRQEPNIGERNYYFRVDVDGLRGHHFHHHRFPYAYDDGHIPPDKAIPPIPAVADPDWFMDVLEKFLATNTVPIEVTSE